jgi:hypothetical protein
MHNERWLGPIERAYDKRGAAVCEPVRAPRRSVLRIVGIEVGIANDSEAEQWRRLRCDVLVRVD